jgi:ribose/xylose/arabinose/galactoside ABC-type transport system permease subunit
VHDIVGEFVDLSVPSVFGIAATILPVLVTNHNWGVWPAAIVAIIAAIGFGAVNGLLVVVLGVNAIVVTLGMGTLLTGLALWMSDLNTVVPPAQQLREDRHVHDRRAVHLVLLRHRSRPRVRLRPRVHPARAAHAVRRRQP